MYNIIPARPEHAKQIVSYVGITCYWKEFVEGNDLGQSFEEFMLQWYVNPRLPDTKVLVKEGDESRIYGCVIAATLDRLGEMPDYTPHLHPRVMEVFGDWFQYPVSDSVVLELFALDPALRGQGYGGKLYQVVEALAAETGKDRIAAFVWSCFPDSLVTLTRRGLMVRGCINFPSPVDIPLLYLEKRPEYTATKDYFQSKPYQAATNMLLS